MDKNKEKELMKKINQLSDKEREGFSTFGNMILEVLAEHDSSAKMLKVFSDLTDEMKNIIDAIYFDLPIDKRDENDEKVKKFTDVMEQFLKICRDFKKENV